MDSIKKAETGTAEDHRPENLFKGQIVITKTRLPDRYPSASAFVDALRDSRTDTVGRTKRADDPWGKWHLEYVAFFAESLSVANIWVKFYDISSAPKRYVAGDQQRLANAGSLRIFGSNIELSEPEFAGLKHYEMRIEKDSKDSEVIASTTLWLLEK